MASFEYQQQKDALDREYEEKIAALEQQYKIINSQTAAQKVSNSQRQQQIDGSPADPLLQQSPLLRGFKGCMLFHNKRLSVLNLFPAYQEIDAGDG